VVSADDAERRVLGGAGRRLAMQAPVIVSGIEHTPALDTALGDRYISEFYGLRPEVPLALYIERGLWDRFLSATR
jgi:hypothetical protein